jgi:hypothetical protein
MSRFGGKSFGFCVLLALASVSPKTLHAQSSGNLEIVSPQGDDVIAVHVNGGDGMMFDLYDKKNPTVRIATYDAKTNTTTALFDLDKADEVKRLIANNGHNTVTPYQGPSPTPTASATPIANATPTSKFVQPSTTGDLPPCPMGSLANYWNGTSWVPMRAPEMLNGKAGFSASDAIRNPFNPNAGNTGIARFKGPESPITVDSSPTFCFFAGNRSQDVLVGFVDVKADHREIEFHRQNRGPESWIPPNRQKAATTKFVGNVAIVTLNEPLPAGQYIVGTNTFAMYDFGVK